MAVFSVARGVVGGDGVGGDHGAGAGASGVGEHE